MYVYVYTPTLSVLTEPVDGIPIGNPDGCERSVAVAPASVYGDPNSIVTGLSPVIVITGGVVSTTFICLVTVLVLPKSSVDV